LVEHSGNDLVTWSEGIDMGVVRLLVMALLFVALGGHIGMSQQSPAGPGASDITPTEEPAGPWSWLKLPTVTMPKLTMPKMPADPLAPIKVSARKVGDGTKKAWEGTKEIFTFGGSKAEQPTARIASAEKPPSMWQRMFGGNEKENEPQGPSTVAEWMAQPRVE
jgi:hypothetical protein